MVSTRQKNTIETYINSFCRTYLASDLAIVCPKTEQDLRSMFLQAYMQFGSGNTGSWRELGTPLDMEGRVKYEAIYLRDSALVHARLCAVMATIDANQWYPWSMADGDFGTEAIDDALRPTLVCWSELVYGKLPKLPVAFDAAELDLKVHPSWPVSAIRLGMKWLLGVFHRCSVVYQVRSAPAHAPVSEMAMVLVGAGVANPDVLANFVRYRLYDILGASCGEWQCKKSLRSIYTAQDAIALVTEWFHGPGNRYDQRNLLIDSNGSLADALEGWCGPGNSTQAWRHLVMPQGVQIDYDLYSALAERYMNSPMFGTIEFLLTEKVGGCWQVADLFSAMCWVQGIPCHGWTNRLANDGAHAAIYLHDDRAILHADALWGPGASLFPTDDLFQPSSIWRPAHDVANLCLTAGIVLNLDGRLEGHSEYGQLWYLYRACILATDYAVRRRYWEAIFRAGVDNPRLYAQSVIDLCGFGVRHGEHGSFDAVFLDFGVVDGKFGMQGEGRRFWTFVRSQLGMAANRNPALDSFGIPNEYQLLKRLVRPRLEMEDWGAAGIPEDLSQEPSILAAIDLVSEVLGLSELSSLTGIEIEE